MTFDPQQKTGITILNLEQDTPEWRDWRRGADLADGGIRVTATAATSIIGTSKFESMEDLWMQIVGLKKRQVNQWAVAPGKKFEPDANRIYCEYVGQSVKPVCIQNSTYPWIGASLDGMDILGRFGVEIKIPGRETLDMVLDGKIPEHYYDQMQWQLLASGNTMEYIDFVVFCQEDGNSLFSRKGDNNVYTKIDGSKMKMLGPIQVKPDYGRQKELFDKALWFREKIMKGESLFDASLEKMADLWLILNRRIKKMTALQDDIANTLKKFEFDKTVNIRGIQMSKRTVSGDKMSWAGYAKGMLDFAKTVDEQLAGDLEAMKDQYITIGEPTISTSIKENTDADMYLPKEDPTEIMTLQELEAEVQNQIENPEIRSW